MIENVVANKMIGPNALGNINNNINIATTNAKPSVSFDQVLSQISQAVGSNVDKAENMAVGHIAGKDVGMTEVVNSVMAAQRSLMTAIAIRDKLVQAYNEIAHMQI